MEIDNLGSRKFVSLKKLVARNQNENIDEKSSIGKGVAKEKKALHSQRLLLGHAFSQSIFRQFFRIDWQWEIFLKQSLLRRCRNFFCSEKNGEDEGKFLP